MAVRLIEDFSDEELARLVMDAQSGLWRDFEGNVRVGNPQMYRVAMAHLLRRSIGQVRDGNKEPRPEYPCAVYPVSEE
jgi:hypothetical protein